MIDGIAEYHRITQKKYYCIGISITILIALFIIDIMTGPAMLSFNEVFSALIAPQKCMAQTYIIVWKIRLPVALMAILVGISLGISGAQMQTILNNPLASPYTIGTSAAAGFGAALAMVWGVHILPILLPFVIPINAFIFSFSATLSVYAIAKLKKGTTEVIVLSGIAILFLFKSLLSLLQFFSSEDQLQGIIFWLFGSLVRASWEKIAIISLFLIIITPLLLKNSWKLTALSLGDQKAMSLGVHIERLRFQTMIYVSLLTAISICFVGTIGFIGLVAPHISKIFVGQEQRFFLPLSGLLGAVLLSAASIGSKFIIPGAIFPVGIVTSFIGVPFFLFIIISKRRIE